MPLFYYTAVSQSGERTSGTKEAADTAELARLLRQENLVLISVQPQKKFQLAGWAVFKRVMGAVNIFNRVRLVDKMMFARHLAVMVKAGFSLNKALQVLAVQTSNKQFAKVIGALEEDIRKGTSFGDALAKFPDIFSDLFINMVKVGEVSGGLEENLKLLAIQMKKDNSLLSKIKSAMIYPAVILVAMIGIGIAMMILVIPKLISTFEDLNVELPLTTRIVIWTSKFLTNYWWLAIIIILGLVILVRVVLRSKPGKDSFDKLILKMPVFGDISKKINSARLARTFSSLVESGVSMVKALEIVSGTLSNNLFKDSLIVMAAEVQKGTSLSHIFGTFPHLYPPMVTQMIQVGEETGTLGEITKRLAEFYEEEVSNIMRGLSSIIEPILMIIIGAAVGFFAISMIQPMYSVMSAI